MCITACMGSEATLKSSYPVDPREVSSGVKRLHLLDQLTGPWQSISVEPLRDSALCLFILVLGTDARQVLFLRQFLTTLPRLPLKTL